MPCYRIDGITPVVAKTAYIAGTATLIGDVIVGEGVYIAPGASLRGDFGRIIIADGANVQDNCVMHGFPKTDTLVEEEGHVGHSAILHGCRVGKNAMIGIGAIVLDNAVIGESAIIAAGAVVTANMVVPPRSLCVGMPAKVLRQLRGDEMEWKKQGTLAYQQLAQRALDGKTGMQEVQPLPEIEEGRRRIEDVLPEMMEALMPKKSGSK